MIKISVGMIVFNAESILPYGMLHACIEQIYDIAHEIIIVEGATKADGITHRKDGDTSQFTKDGKSTDKTLDIIKSYPDKNNKIKIITKNGFWNGKTEMCNSYSKIATGDYVWHIDSDEFYKENDIITIIKLLEKYNPFAVHFYCNHFFGDWFHCIDENCGTGWSNAGPWMRIFKHKPGYSRWLSHEPPQYIYENNLISNNQRNILNRQFTLSRGIKLYHYGYVNFKQVLFKSKFYGNNEVIDVWDKWKKDDRCLLPGHTWTNKFKFEDHPLIIQKLIKKNGEIHSFVVI